MFLTYWKRFEWLDKFKNHHLWCRAWACAGRKWWRPAQTVCWLWTWCWTLCRIHRPTFCWPEKSDPWVEWWERSCSCRSCNKRAISHVDEGRDRGPDGVLGPRGTLGHSPSSHFQTLDQFLYFPYFDVPVGRAIVGAVRVGRHGGGVASRVSGPEIVSAAPDKNSVRACADEIKMAPRTKRRQAFALLCAANAAVRGQIVRKAAAHSPSGASGSSGCSSMHSDNGNRPSSPRAYVSDCETCFYFLPNLLPA